MDHTTLDTAEKAERPNVVVELTNVTPEATTDANLDVAGRWLSKMALRPDAAEMLGSWTPEEEKTIVRRSDWIIIPLLTGAVTLGAVDKVAIGSAAVLGMRTDLNLVGQDYSWSSSILFFGAMATMFPALFIMQRFPAGKVFAGNVMIWGIVMMCMAGTKNFGGIAACRFILGLFEALIFPAMNLIISSWFTRKEQVMRMAIVFSTMSSLINGLISYGVSFLPATSKIHAWQLQFLVIGALTLLWGVAVWLVFPDSPTTAWFLNDRQKTIAVLRLRDNRTGVENKMIKKSQIIEGFIDPKTWLIFFINICLSLPNSGINTFNSIIIAGLGFDTRQTLLLSMPVGIISWVAAFIFSWIAIKTRQRCMTTIASCIIPLLSTVLLHVIPRSNQGGSLGALFLIYFYWPPYLLMATVSMANTSGYTKKIIVYGVAYYGYLTGSIVGPQCFLAYQAPDYTGGVIAMLICYCVAILLVTVYWFHVNRLNRAKANALAETGDYERVNIVEEWKDETDFENPHFVYLH